jgi:hypothetical protein
MAPDPSGKPDPSGSLGAPVHERGGADIEEAIAKAEAGSQVEGVHRVPDEVVEPGTSRIEQMRELDGIGEGEVVGNPDEGSDVPPPGPGPADIGSGGAQRIVGARISDRVSAGEPVPDGPPFNTLRERGEAPT